MAKEQRIGGSPFMIGEAPGGFNARLYKSDSGDVVAEVVIDISKEGPPGHAHGGALVALVDEVMGACAWNSGYKVLAANLNMNFVSPVPLGLPLIVRGRVTSKDGRKVFTAGEVVLPNGEIAVRGTGLFIEAPDLFGDHDYSYGNAHQTE